MNLFCLDGNLTANPEMHENRATFSIAHNYKKNDEKKVMFMRCVCFNEFLIKNIITELKKGDKIFIKGVLEEKEYNNEKRISTIVNYIAICYKKEIIPF